MSLLNKMELENIMKIRNSGDFQLIIEKVLDEKYSPSDVNVKPHTITNWRKEGIRITGYTSGKDQRKKYNLIELVWLKMLQTLKEFKVNSSYINNLSELVWMNVYGETNQMMENPIFKNLIGSPSLEQKKLIEEMLSRMYVPYLEMFILDILLFSSDLSIVIDKNGFALPYKAQYLLDNDENFNQLKTMLKGSHYSISINEAIADFVFEFPEPETILLRLELISNKEQTILEEIRKDGVKSINLRFDNEGKVDLIEISKVIKSKDLEKITNLKQLLFSNAYKDIEIKTQHNKIIYINEKTKKKI